MKILVVGNGGREHALLWKLQRDDSQARLFVTRGNGGTGGIAKAVPLDANDGTTLARWAEQEGINLAIIGPEAPLASGLADILLRYGIPTFGPSQSATAIEASKAYAKRLMEKAGVPSAAYRTFTESAEAEAYIREMDRPLVVKASGLAAGKGAIVCDTAGEAAAAARSMLLEERFGDAGAEIVVEERMEGAEVSVFAICDGKTALPMLPIQDHKRALEGDEGPNTGGMGAYAPVPGLPEDFLATVRERIFQPTLAALAKDGRAFRGLLYAGLMLTEDGPKVVEFNARFGDPETQVLMPLLESSLLEPLLAVARGESLEDTPLRWKAGAALTTVLASAGYPGDYETGKPITVPESVTAEAGVYVFHAGTARKDGALVTSGGRVLAVTGVAEDLSAAAAKSRAAAEAIAFEGKQWRRDIGWRALDC